MTAKHGPWRAFAPALLGLLLAGCAVPVPLRETDATGTLVVETVHLDAQPFAAHWYLPHADAAALVVFEHGFARRCANLRETTRRLMAEGLMALCVDVPMAGGNPVLAEALARHLARDPLAPGGRGLPRRVMVAGHSAGAAFALSLGAHLETLAPGRLAGALLVDPVAPSAPASAVDPAAAPEAAAAGASGPVATEDGRARFEAALRAVSAEGRRPVLAFLAPPHRCNAGSNALPALQRAQQAARAAGSNAFVIVHLPEGSLHADIEGENTDALAEWACGAVQSSRTAELRARLVDGLRTFTLRAGREGASAPADGAGQPAGARGPVPPGP